MINIWKNWGVRKMTDKETYAIIDGRGSCVAFVEGNPIGKIAELETENERLKEENKTLEQFLSKEPLALQALQKGYASYKKSTDVFYEMVKTYKQTLQEIKGIAERQLLVTNVRTYQMVYYADFSEYRNEILQKITKAEEE